MTFEEAMDAIRAVERQHSSNSSVYVGTMYGRRCLVHRLHDLAGCDHSIMGPVSAETERALATAGVEIRLKRGD